MSSSKPIIDDLTAKLLGINLGYSQGLEYSLNEDNTLSVKGIGSCVDVNIIVPEKYAGAYVTRIGFKAFYGCTQIESVRLPEGIIEIDQYAFAGCETLQSMQIPNSVEEIEDNAFEDCINITDITFGTFESHLRRIGRFAFYECRMLNAPHFPWSIESIGESAFENCASFYTLTIPPKVLELPTEIFYGCEKLSSITMYADLKRIGAFSFGRCSSLKYIKFEGKREIWESIEKEDNWNFEMPECLIHCRNGKIKNKSMKVSR